MIEELIKEMEEQDVEEEYAGSYPALKSNSFRRFCKR